MEACLFYRSIRLRLLPMAGAWAHSSAPLHGRAARRGGRITMRPYIAAAVASTSSLIRRTAGRRIQPEEAQLLQGHRR